MKNLAPSFVGTFLATVVATSYVILDENKYHLWNQPTRVILMGGAVLVLLTYAVSWYAIESHRDGKIAFSFSYRDYFLRVMAQLFLGLALAAVGISPALFLIFFLAFVVTSFIWSAVWYTVTKPVFFHDLANLVMCILYSYVAWELFSRAIDFESSYSVMITDPISFETRIIHLRGESANWTMYLGLIIGGVLVNLIILLSRHLALHKAVVHPAEADSSAS